MGVSYWFSKLDLKTEKRGITWKSSKSIHDLGSALGFLSIAMMPRAIGAYLAVRKQK